MLPVQPTERLKGRYPDLKLINFNSPDGVPENECGNLQALAGPIIGGVFDGGPVIRTFWKPSAEEIEALRNGAVIELDFYDGGMPMTAMNVEVDV